MSPRHYNILLKSVQNGSPKIWNEFRQKQGSQFIPNLVGANLSHLNLEGYDLSHARLDGADLSHANLTQANLEKARLKGAKLEGAILHNTNFKGVRLKVVSSRPKASSENAQAKLPKNSPLYIILDDDEE